MSSLLQKTIRKDASSKKIFTFPFAWETEAEDKIPSPKLLMLSVVAEGNSISPLS